MKDAPKSHEEAVQDLMTRLDDLVREFLGERPSAAVGLELTLLQRRDAELVDVSHCWGQWEPGDSPGAGWVKGMKRAASPPPTRAERRAVKRGGAGSVN